MRFIFLIFFAITPAFSMDGADDDYDAGLAAAVQASLHDHILDPIDDEREAIMRSLNPDYNVAARAGPGFAESDDEEELLRRAIELSLEGRAVSKDPFEVLVQKGHTAGSEAEFLRGVDPKDSAVNLVGYMVFLTHKDGRNLENLMVKVDKTAWDQVYRKLGLGKRTASHVFILLDEAKKLISKQSAAYVRTLSNLVDQIDNVMLDLISGKWGFSRSKPSPDVLEKLKSGATEIGRRMGNKSEEPSSFASKVFEHFGKGLLVQTASDPLLRKHRLSAFSYIANGYKAGLIPDFKEIYTTRLTALVQPYFTSEDLKGFSVAALIGDPSETLRKIARAARITISQKTVFDRFIAPLKATVSGESLGKLKAFLSTFDSGDIYEILNDDERLSLLNFFQRALQDKTAAEVHQLLSDLIDNDLLPEDVREIEPILAESAHYEATVTDRIYAESMRKVRADKKGSAEPQPGKNYENLDTGLQVWLRDYFNALYEKGYSLREAYIVKYPGVLEGREVDSGDEVTERQAEVLNEHMAAYKAADDIKQFIFPGIPAGQKAVFVPTVTGARIDVINEDDGRVLRARDLRPARDEPMFIQITSIKVRADLYKIDPNVLPASVEKATVPSDIPLNFLYAVRGGQGISLLQKIQSRGRAIDFLIKEGRISRSLKLPILLYLDSW